jgi:prepilin-type processing-associated H-X9-DG protein
MKPARVGKLLPLIVLGVALVSFACLAIVSFLKTDKSPYRHEGNAVYYNDEQKTQGANCVNNMKQIGLGFRMWAGDNGDLNPYKIHTNHGGTMELCDRDKNGLDRNSWQHLLVLSNELNTPRVLVCPKDPQHKYVDDWAHLGPASVTYLVYSGIDDTNPTNVLAVCPFDGNTLYCDGHVVKGKDK